MTQIIPNMTIADAVAEYHSCMDDLRKAFALLHSAEQRLQMFGDSCYIRGRRENAFQDFSDPEPAATIMEREAWRAIVGRMGIEQVMSIAARKTLAEQLDSGDMPELTVENVMAMMQGMHGRLSEFAEETIREVWEWLRPAEDSWSAKKYKSNPRFELGKCVKVTGAVNRMMLRTFYVNDHVEKRLDALERAFRLLDGNGLAQRGLRSDIVSAINATPHGSRAECSTQYFRVKLFRNGAAHIYFQRADLVAEFNRICGGMNLRGQRAA